MTNKQKQLGGWGMRCLKTPVNEAPGDMTEASSFTWIISCLCVDFFAWVKRLSQIGKTRNNKKHTISPAD